MTLLYFEDCPNWRLAEARLHQVLVELGRDSSVLGYQLVTSPEQAEALGFRGSPTIVVDGRDPFADPSDPVGLSCRLYRGAGGVEHAPTVEQLRAVLADAS